MRKRNKSQKATDTQPQLIIIVTPLLITKSWSEHNFDSDDIIQMLVWHLYFVTAFECGHSKNLKKRKTLKNKSIWDLYHRVRHGEQKARGEKEERKRVENKVVILHYVYSGPTERMTRLDKGWRVQALQRGPVQPQPAKRQGRADPRPASEQPLNNSAHHDATLTSASETESTLLMPLNRLQ